MYIHMYIHTYIHMYIHTYIHSVVGGLPANHTLKEHRLPKMLDFDFDNEAGADLDSHVGM